MAKGQGKSKLIATIVVLGITLLVVGGIAVFQNNSRHEFDAKTQVETTNDASTTPQATPTDTDVASDTPETSTVDPKTLSSIDIEPLAITVSYTKGIPGFEFGVKRTGDGTQYVEFSAPELAGTKCTNDAGTFASIIKGVKANEDSSTLSKKVTVGATTYGLSLTGPDCTNDVALLKKYQTAFSDGFSQLKEL